MSILNDRAIIARSDASRPKPMITPFVAMSAKLDERGNRLISYGVSSYGYDMRLSPHELKVFTNLNSKVVDPRKMDPDCYSAPQLLTDENGLLYVLQPPNSTMLGHTVEYFHIPRDIFATVTGKSTYARASVGLICTPLEPEWEGNLVVEIVNYTNSPAKIYPNQGIGQLCFFRAEHECAVSYADRGGKYQGQTGTQDAKV